MSVLFSDDMLAVLMTALVSASLSAPSPSASARLPLWRGGAAPEDWLTSRRVSVSAGVYRTQHPNEIVLANGLISRTFRLAPNAATVDMQVLATGESLIRAVRPEAFLVLTDRTLAVGGLVGQPDAAFLRARWLDRMSAGQNDLRFVGFETGRASARLPWTPNRSTASAAWPPSGVSLALHFEAPASLSPGLHVDVYYELYDGLPVLAKWISVHNDSASTVRLKSFVVESLACVEPESISEDTNDWLKPNISIFTDYSFGGAGETEFNCVVRWGPDEAYTTQVNQHRKTPCLLAVGPPIGPDAEIRPGSTFQSFRCFELLHDSRDRERKGLGVRRLFRAMAPWITENPLMLHVTSTDSSVIRRAIDQAAECGFEMVVISFWTGFDMEDLSAPNVMKYRKLRDYAHSKGIGFGGYSLLASRSINAESDVVDPKTGRTDGAIFGHSPCLGSAWGIGYFAALRSFIERTRLDVLEHDGSYPGDVCASTNHPGHRGLPVESVPAARGFLSLVPRPWRLSQRAGRLFPRRVE